MATKSKTTKATKNHKSASTPAAASKKAPPGATSRAPLPVVSPAEIAAWGAIVEQLRAALPALPAMTAMEKRRTGKMRKGGIAIGRRIAHIAEQYGVVLPQFPTDQVDAQAETILALSRLLVQLSGVTTILTNYQFGLETAMWKTTLGLYKVLKGLSVESQAMEATLAPATQFFAYRTPTVKAARAKAKRGEALVASAKEG